MAKEVFKIVKQTVSEFLQDDAMVFGAAVAFYTVLSLAPLLIILVATAGLLETDARRQILEQVEILAGSRIRDSVSMIVENASANRGGGQLSAVIGGATLLLSASGVFGQLQVAMNRIWNVRARPGLGVLGWLRKRLLSGAVVLFIGALILASVLVSALLELLISDYRFIWQILNIAINWLVFTFLFAMIFKFLPDVRIAWRDVWMGALITTVLFVAGKFVLGFYFSHASVGSAYGAAGSLVVLLVWVYYSCLILFFGAEFTQVFARRLGSHIIPDKHAVWLHKYAEKTGREYAVAE